MDLNYSFPAQLIKSGEESNGRIPITIVPNHPSPDRVNDKIILKAFDDECIKGFLFDGVYDYDHISVLGKTPLEKAQAIIGQPEEFYIDEEKGQPVCHGFLFKGNPYVDNVIMPALLSGSKVFGASVGGRILKKSDDLDPVTKKICKAISKISLKHIAITPLQKAIHQGTSVQLRKSCSGGGKCNEKHNCGEKCNKSFELQFDSFDCFLKSFEDDTEIIKALTAGSSTNIPDISGGQTIQNQSLEGSKINFEKIKYTMPFIIENLVSGSLYGKDYKQCVEYLIKRGFNESEAVETIQLLARNNAKLIELKI